METKTQTGLYFIGEVVDVAGWLGGYNLQWLGHRDGALVSMCKNNYKGR